MKQQTIISKYDVAAIAAINGLDDNENYKLTAKQQRELFGFAVAGRKDISFDPSNQGTVRIGRTVTGKDYCWKEYSYEAFAQAVNEQRTLEAW